MGILYFLQFCICVHSTESIIPNSSDEDKYPYEDDPRQYPPQNEADQSAKHYAYRQVDKESEEDSDGPGHTSTLIASGTFFEAERKSAFLKFCCDQLNADESWSPRRLNGDEAFVEEYQVDEDENRTESSDTMNEAQAGECHSHSESERHVMLGQVGH